MEDKIKEIQEKLLEGENITEIVWKEDFINEKVDWKGIGKIAKDFYKSHKKEIHSIAGEGAKWALDALKRKLGDKKGKVKTYSKDDFSEEGLEAACNGNVSVYKPTKKGFTAVVRNCRSIGDRWGGKVTLDHTGLMIDTMDGKNLLYAGKEDIESDEDLQKAFVKKNKWFDLSKLDIGESYKNTVGILNKLQEMYSIEEDIEKVDRMLEDFVLETLSDECLLELRESVNEVIDSLENDIGELDSNNIEEDDGFGELLDECLLEVTGPGKFIRRKFIRGQYGQFQADDVAKAFNASIKKFTSYGQHGGFTANIFGAGETVGDLRRNWSGKVTYKPTEGLYIQSKKKRYVYEGKRTFKDTLDLKDALRDKKNWVKVDQHQGMRDRRTIGRTRRSSGRGSDYINY